MTVVFFVEFFVETPKVLSSRAFRITEVLETWVAQKK